MLSKILTLAIPKYLCVIGPGVLSNSMLFPYDTDICVIHELNGTCYIVSRSYVDNWAEPGIPQTHPEAKGYGERDVLGYKSTIEDWEERHNGRDMCTRLINVANLKERLQELGYISSKDSWQKTRYNRNEFIDSIKRHFRMDDPIDRENEKYIYLVMETKDDGEKEHIEKALERTEEVNRERFVELMSHEYNGAINNEFFFQVVYFKMFRAPKGFGTWKELYAARFHIHHEKELAMYEEKLDPSLVLHYIEDSNTIAGKFAKDFEWTILLDEPFLRSLVDFKNDEQRKNYKYVFFGARDKP